MQNQNRNLTNKGSFSARACLGADLGLLCICVCCCCLSVLTEIHWEKKWSQNGSTLEPFWKTVPLWRVEQFFSLIIMFRKKYGTKIVPGMELSYVPLFSQCRTPYLMDRDNDEVTFLFCQILWRFSRISGFVLMVMTLSKWNRPLTLADTADWNTESWLYSTLGFAYLGWIHYEYFPSRQASSWIRRGFE